MRLRANLARGLATLSAGSLLWASSGCAAMWRGDTQLVRVKTNPPGQTVHYRGQPVQDGQTILVDKDFDRPAFEVGGLLIPMTADPDPWVIGDAALLLVYVVPGLIALGVDYANGTWRLLHETQVVSVPAVERAAEE